MVRKTGKRTRRTPSPGFNEKVSLTHLGARTVDSIQTKGRRSLRNHRPVPRAPLETVFLVEQPGQIGSRITLITHLRNLEGIGRCVRLVLVVEHGPSQINVESTW